MPSKGYCNKFKIIYINQIQTAVSYDAAVFKIIFFIIKNFYGMYLQNEIEVILCVYRQYTHLDTEVYTLDILISNDSPVRLYEQIENAIKNNILNGNLKAGEMLPSIRMLAKELKVSIITTKRAYEELEKEGFIETVVGKGTFVSGTNSERLKEAAMAEMEGRLEEVIISAKSLGLSLEECIEILKNLYGEV